MKTPNKSFVSFFQSMFWSVVSAASPVPAALSLPPPTPQNTAAETKQKFWYGVFLLILEFLAQLWEENDIPNISIKIYTEKFVTLSLS